MNLLVHHGDLTLATEVPTLDAMNSGDVLAGRFELLERTFEGEHGPVFRARDRPSGRLVAIKLLRSQTALARVRFLREAALLSGLSHPGVIPILSHGATKEDQPYLVTPWFEEGTLRARLDESGPLGVVEAVQLVALIAGALAEVHRRGITHRDIKPSNVVLRREGGGLLPVLIDFGLARTDSDTERLSRSGMPVGTVAYMAPEQLRSPAEVGARSDVHGLGCVLYECLTGRPPFEGSVGEIVYEIVHGTRPDVRAWCPRLPLPVANLVLRMMALDPAERPRDGAAVANELQRVSQLEPPAADPSAEVTLDYSARLLSFAAAPRLSLVVVYSSVASLAGARIRLTEEVASLGRDGAVQGARLADSRMSRKHVTLGTRSETRRVWVRDEGSRNGTFVNGRPIRSADLEPGDVVRLGDTLLVLDEGEAPEDERDGDPTLGGLSVTMGGIRRLIARAAAEGCPVLVTGASGVERAAVAETIHRLSGRGGPLVQHDCGGKADPLSATGARSGQEPSLADALLKAQEGTLLLADVELLPTAEQRVARHVLDDWTAESATRVVASTEMDLFALAASGRFSPELLARLSVWPVELPPLARRRADTLRVFTRALGEELAPHVSVSPWVAEALLIHDWPLGVAEVRQLAARIRIVLGGRRRIERSDLPASLNARLDARRSEER